MTIIQLYHHSQWLKLAISLAIDHHGIDGIPQPADLNKINSCTFTPNIRACHRYKRETRDHDLFAIARLSKKGLRSTRLECIVIVEIFAPLLLRHRYAKFCAGNICWYNRTILFSVNCEACHGEFLLQHSKLAAIELNLDSCGRVLLIHGTRKFLNVWMSWDSSREFLENSFSKLVVAREDWSILVSLNLFVFWERFWIFVFFFGNCYNWIVQYAPPFFKRFVLIRKITEICCFNFIYIAFYIISAFYNFKEIALFYIRSENINTLWDYIVNIIFNLSEVNIHFIKNGKERVTMNENFK